MYENEEVERKPRAPRVNYKQLHSDGKQDKTPSGSHFTTGCFSSEAEETEDEQISVSKWDDCKDEEDKLDVAVGGSPVTDVGGNSVGETDELELLRSKLGLLDKEEKELRRQKEIEDLRRQLERKQKTVKKLKGESVLLDNSKGKTDKEVSHKNEKISKKDKVTNVKNIDFGKLTINDLRNDKSLRSKARANMNEVGIDLFNSGSNDESELEIVKTKNSKKKHKKQKKNSRTVEMTVSESDSDVDSKVSKSRVKKSKKLKKHKRVKAIPLDSNSSSDSDSAQSKSKKQKSRSVELTDLDSE